MADRKFFDITAEDVNCVAEMAAYRAAYAEQKRLKAVLENKAKLVIPHKEGQDVKFYFSKWGTWSFEVVEADKVEAKAAKPKIGLAQYLASQANGGHAV